METALLTPADAEALKAARSLNSRPTVPNIPSIKLKNSEKKVEGLTRGNYFIEDYDGENKTFRDIGPNPVVHILHRCYTYSYYDEDASQLVAWTSEIDGFTEYDPTVYLYSKRDGKASVEFCGNYPSVKQYMLANYSVTKGEKQKSLMKFQNCLYVLFEGKPYRMFVSNAGAAGIAEGAKGPDFKHPQKESLQNFIDTTRGIEMEAALLEFDCQLGSRFIEDAEQPYYIMTFTNAGPNEKIPETMPVYRKFMMDLAKNRQWELDRMGGNKVQTPTHEEAVEAFGEDMSAVIDA
jgi:hypothetical protein